MEDEQAAIDAVLKFAVLALVIGALLGLATFVGIKMLGINEGSAGGDDDYSLNDDPPKPLPTKALDDPSDTSSPSDTPSESESPDEGITLSVNPGQVGAGQRINLTGSYPGEDNVLLKVQRMENGDWTDFANVQVPVRVGTFATYILTSRTGEQQFRLIDPRNDTASNEVTVTVG